MALQRWNRFCVLVLALLPTVAQADSCVDLHRGLRRVAMYDLPSSGIESSGDRIIVQRPRGEFVILSIANPLAPVARSTIATTAVNDFAVSGNWLYVASGAAGLVVHALHGASPPRNPVSLYADRIAVAGPHGCVLVHDNDPMAMLIVLDLTDPSSPLQRGSVRVSRLATNIAIAEEHAVVAQRDAGIAVVDLSDPDRPQIVANIDLGTYVVDVTLAGSYAYLACSSSYGPTGLLVLDLAVPGSPVVVGNEPEGCTFPHKIEVEGNTAYLIGSSVFGTASIESPTSPRSLGSTSTNAGDFALAGGHAYLSTEEGIEIVDLADPRSPAPHWRLDMDADRVTHGGGLALVTSARSAMHVVALDDPQSVLATVTGSAVDAAIAGTHAYMLDLDRGLRIFDLATPGSPVEQSGLVLPGTPNRIEVRGDHAYITAGLPSSNPYWRPGVLHVVEVADALVPRLVGSAALSRRGNGLDLEGSYVLVASGFQNLEEPAWGALEVVDISVPSLPVVVGMTTLDFMALDVEAESDRAWVTGGRRHHWMSAGTLATFDIVRPHAPELLSASQVLSYGFAIERAGPFVLVADETQGIVAFDVENPRAPRMVGSIHVPRPKGLELVGDGILVADDGVHSSGTRGSLRRYGLPCEVATPVAWSDLTIESIDQSVRLQWRTQVEYEEFIILRAIGGGDFETVATVHEPEVSGRWVYVDSRVAPATYRYVVVGRRRDGGSDASAPMTIIVAAGARPAIHVLRSPVRERVELQLQVANAGRQDLEVFDVAGRSVRILSLGRLPAGGHRATWDGRDAHGRAVASGVYLLKLQSATERVVLLR